MTSRSDLSYKSAGVDIEAGEALVERIKAPIRRTRRPEVLGALGGFGGLFRVPEGYSAPVLVAGADGVGTKLKLAIEHDAHERVGVDLVAMCVNDIAVLGAEPLFFLDYFVTPALDVDVAERVITGIAEGCRQAGAALLGGETAEHPGMHAPGEYDLAGFAVGIVEQERIVDGRRIEAGDTLVGIASSGPHSNGFSLIRRVLERQDAPPAPELVAELLEPTRIYVRPLLGLCGEVDVKGLAHITGGGLTENIPRVLPEGLGVEVDAASWPRPRVFGWLEEAGVEPAEMYRTFNCGIGMVAIVAPGDAERAIAALEAAGEHAHTIGRVVTDPRSRAVIQ